MTENINALVPFGQEDVEVIEKESAYRGFYRVDKYTLRHRLFQGGWSKTMVREVMDRGHAVVVLPYDPVRDSIVMLSQFRVGAVTQLGAPEPAHSHYKISPWLVELVAGMIDAGESEEAVAAREMREEQVSNGTTLTFAQAICRAQGGLNHRAD